MYFQSLFREANTNELQTEVATAAKEVGLKYNYFREKDCLAVMFHHAILRDPSDFTDSFFSKKSFEFTFEMDEGVSGEEFWKAFSPQENTVQNFVVARDESFNIEIRYDTNIDNKGNFSHDGYYLEIMPIADVKDPNLLSGRLESDFPKIFVPGHSDTKQRIRFEGKPKIDLEKWSKQEVLDILSDGDWNQLTYYCSTIEALNEVLSKIDLIRQREETKCHFHAVFRDFPNQAMLKSWIGKFGPPSYTIVSGKYLEGLDPFKKHEKYPPTGMIRYPIFEKTFNDNSVIGLDLIQRENEPSIIEVFAFHSWSSKAAEKRAKFIRKKLGTEFIEYEGELWNRFSPA